MPPERGRPVPLFLTARVSGQEKSFYLMLDVCQPQQMLEAGTLLNPPDEAGAGVIVHDSEAVEVQAGRKGCLLVSRPLLWSILDPCAASGHVQVDVEDAFEAEQQLRAEGRRLWQCLRWWRGLSPSLRKTCRNTLASFSRPGGRLPEVLDELAERSEGDPFAGWLDPSGKSVNDPPAAPTAALKDALEWPGGEPQPLPEGLAQLSTWMLDAAGFGACYGSGFHPRSQQAEMALIVARALEANRPLMVEAGTGVGKTLAYLIPLLKQLGDHDARAVVSTHTRALQVQILEHDLPRLRQLVPELRGCLLMGRGNYLCQRQRLAFLSAPVTSWRDACATVALRLWLAATREGMREELSGHPILKDRLRELFDAPQPCAPSICYEQDACFVQKARRLAHQADLVVVNHSLLMHDFLAANKLIGPYSLLVVDEAHRLPPVALDSHAVRIDQKRLRALKELVGETGRPAEAARLFRNISAQLLPIAPENAEIPSALTDLATAVGKLMRAYQTWWSALCREFEARLEGKERPQGRVRVYDEAEAFGSVRAETGRLLQCAATACTAYAAFSQRLESLAEVPAQVDDSLVALAQTGEMLSQMQHDVRFITEGANEEWVVWLEPHPDSGIRALGATRLESGELLRDYWRERSLAPVMTSATLAIGEDFSHLMTELGLRRLQPAVTTAVVPSPFAYERQALFLTIADIPAPDQSDFALVVCHLLRQLWRRLGRKTMALFTAYQQMHKVAHCLEHEPVDTGLFANGTAASRGRRGPEVLVQTAGRDAADLLARFRRRPRAMLLGTSTFWEGVDFPGEDLEVLVVCKLPFLVPTDPWVEARCERIQAAGENPFRVFMVRDAVLRLRQGLGRLIRSQSDRGVVILLDNRLHGKSYGGAFLNALPGPFHVCRDLAEIVDQSEEFFARTA